MLIKNSIIHSNYLYNEEVTDYMINRCLKINNILIFKAVYWL